MIMEIETLLVIARSNAVQARAVFHEYCRSNYVVIHNVATAVISILCCIAAALFCTNPQIVAVLQNNALKILLGDKKNKSATSIQAAWRGYQDRQSCALRHGASVLIQSRIRGIIVRSILAGQGLPTLARAVVQEDGVQQGEASAHSGCIIANNIREDCRNLIAAFHDEDSEANVNSQDEGVKMFGTQVKAIMEVRMRLLAAVVLQSWCRMIICQTKYRKVLPSLNTEPLSHMVSEESTQQQEADEGLSFMSSLSSWSSTWNRHLPSKLDAPSSSFFVGASSSHDQQAFKPTIQEKKALELSIKDHASSRASIVLIQAWWRASTVRAGLASKSMSMKNVVSDGTMPTPDPGAPDQNKKGKLLQNSTSENTMRTSNISIGNINYSFQGQGARSRTSKSVGAKRRRRKSNYYRDLWRSTVERVTECHSICNATIESTSSMECSSREAVEVGRAFFEDPTKYEAMLAKISKTRKSLPACSALPSILAEVSQKHIDARGCGQMTEDAVGTTKVSVMKMAEQIKAWKRQRRRRGASSRSTRSHDEYNADRELLDVEPLSYANTNASTIQESATRPMSPPAIGDNKSSRSQTPYYTFSTPSSYTYTYQQYDTSDTSDRSSAAIHRTVRQKQREAGMDYAFCAEPLLPTSMSSSSESSSSDSQNSCIDSYYSIDDIDARDDGEDDVTYEDSRSRNDESRSRYAAGPSKPKARYARRSRFLDDDGASMPSCAV